MLTQELNDLLTHVGPGTPQGEYLRRYWWPVSLSADIRPGGQPRKIKILDEDLVLFRDLVGRPGLVGLHCSHRLVSLAYGRVEDGGIRCPMHGWLYDVAGHCLEQPAEPADAFKDRVRHPAYPCQDMAGLIFAYLGPPEKVPLLPRYEVLARPESTRQVTWYSVKGGYLQHLEGAWDTIHAAYLHNGAWAASKREVLALPKAKIEFTETDYGLWQRGVIPLPGAVAGLIYTYFFMPAGFIRLQEPQGEGDIQKYHSWYVPVDDGSSLRFQVACAPGLNLDGTPYEWRGGDGQLTQPGADQDYGRDYERVDSISGINPSTPGHFRAQDTMANETQGYPVVDRAKEHLGANDPVLTAMRMMIIKSVADVQKGLDPKHIIRDPEQNQMVYVRGSEAMEYFVSERASLLAVG